MGTLAITHPFTQDYVLKPLGRKFITPREKQNTGEDIAEKTLSEKIKEWKIAEELKLMKIEQEILGTLLNIEMVNVLTKATAGSLSGLRKGEGEFTFDRGAVDRAKALLTNSTWGLKKRFEQNFKSKKNGVAIIYGEPGRHKANGRNREEHSDRLVYIPLPI